MPAERQLKELLKALDINCSRFVRVCLQNQSLSKANELRRMFHVLRIKWITRVKLFLSIKIVLSSPKPKNVFTHKNVGKERKMSNVSQLTQQSMIVQSICRKTGQRLFRPFYHSLICLDGASYETMIITVNGKTQLLSLFSI